MDEKNYKAIKDGTYQAVKESLEKELPVAKSAIDAIYNGVVDAFRDVFKDKLNLGDVVDEAIKEVLEEKNICSKSKS